MKPVSSAAQHCPACDAPALSGRDRCWSCGSSLTAPPAAPVAPPQVPPASPAAGLFPCARCGEPVALYHRNCRSCGTPIHAPVIDVRSGGIVTSPGDWVEQRQPDGTVLLREARRGRQRKLVIGAVPPAMLLWAAFTIEFGRHGWYRHPPSPDTRTTFLLLGAFLGALALGFSAWMILRQDEWRVGPDFLEIRRSLLGRSWTRGYRGASLVLQQRRPHNRRSAFPVPEREWPWTLFVDEGFGRQQLTDPLFPSSEARVLGQFLARETGWELREEPAVW